MSQQQIFVGRLDIDSHGDSWLLETARETLLVDVKTRYDPANFFRINQNLEPRAAAAR